MAVDALLKEERPRTDISPRRKGYYLYVTEACNLRCSYCFVREKHNHRHLTREKADSILRFVFGEALHLDEIYVHFFGGEPLIQPGMVDYLATELRAWEKTSGSRVRLGITTNGTLLTVRNCELLKRHQIGVQLSLDGSQRGNDVHRKLMGGTSDGRAFGAFALVQIPHYFDYFGGERPNCRMTVTVHNLPFLSDSIKELHQLGFKSFSMIPDFDCGPWAPGHLVKYEGEMERVFEYWAAHRDIAVNTIDKTIRQLTQKTARTHLCRVGTMIVGITIDGDIYPCHDFAGRYAADPEERRTLLIGSVDNGYCQNLATFQDLAVNLDGASEVGRNCTACWAKWACSRGCPYMNYARAHDARTVNSAYCAMTRINCSIALRWMSVLTEYRFVNSRNPLVVKKKRDATREKDPVVSENTPADSRFGRIGARTSETGRNAASVDSVGTVD